MNLVRSILSVLHDEGCSQTAASRIVQLHFRNGDLNYPEFQQICAEYEIEVDTVLNFSELLEFNEWEQTRSLAM